jgi:hypothetical protein
MSAHDSKSCLLQKGDVVMLATRLVRLIESHAEKLSEDLIHKLEHDPRCGDLRNVPEDELRRRSYEVYRHLSDWLLGKSEHDLQDLYANIGKRRAQQKVRLSHVIYALNATKELLWQFIRDEGVVTRPVELFGEMELFLLLDRFFDQAAYFASVAHEEASKTECVAA